VVSDAWLPADSYFRFVDNLYDYSNDDNDEGNKYGTVMFSTFEQHAKQTEDCMKACKNQKYLLQALTRTWIQYTTY
jgi:peptide methionine sulfoxide reductase MsrA